MAFGALVDGEPFNQLGDTIGQARLGYINVKKEFEARKISAIAFGPERVALIRQSFELYATGEYSMKRLE